MANEITVLTHGPLQIKEAARLVDGETGQEIKVAKWPAYLCRCGKSDNKPFCDGMHKKGGFVGTCSKAALGSP